MKILDFGSLNLDHVFQVDHFPDPGETLRPLSVSLFPGGKGLNQAVAASLAGSDVTMAGTIGQDGDFLVNVLREKGVDPSLVTVSDTVHTGQAIIETDPAGDNRILLDPAANETCQAAQIREALTGFGPEDLLLCQNEISQVPELLRQASNRNLKILFNPAPMTEEVLDIDLNGVTCVAVNETECKRLLGNDDPVPDRLCRRFLEKWPDSSILLTLGSAGALFAKKGYGCFMPSFKVPVCDTTGAGDTFLGYFADGLSRSMPVGEAMRRAAAASALAIQKPGAASSIPEAGQVEEFLKSRPERPVEFTL